MQKFILIILFLALFPLSHPARAQDAPDAPTDDSPPNVQLTEVSDKAQRAAFLKDFQSQLARVGDSKIISCNHVVQYVVTDLGVDDYSYGAACHISSHDKPASDKNHHPKPPEGLYILMCNDVTVGKFTVGGSDPHTLDGIGDFIEKNCPPGNF